jgi:peptide/nickel transport system permease protein
MALIARKVVVMLAVLLVVSFFTFLLTDLLPGDPTIAILGPSATTQARAELRQQLGLDKPLVERYFNWLGNAFEGNLGKSYVNQESVGTAISQRLPVTLELLVLSQIIALVVAIPLGILAALRPNGLLDRMTTTISFGLLAIPAFTLGVFVVLIFAVDLHLFPATGYTALTANPAQNLRSLFLPSLVLALGSLAVYVRILRADMIATLQEDFVTMARAKGMSTPYILLRHAFRPSTFALVTVIGLNVGTLIGGAILVEQIFALPGIGTLTVSSIFGRDYLVVQGCILVITVGYVLVNFVIDLLYPVLDPRTRYARSGA